MRVLFTIQPAASHLDPMLPLAREMLSRGWEVSVAASPAMAESVDRRGLMFHPVGIDWHESEAARTFPELEDMPLDQQAVWWVTDIFADRAATPSAVDLVEVVEEWGVDLVVRDYWEFGGWAAACATGLPCGVVGLAMYSGPEDMDAFIGGELRSLLEHVAADPGRGVGSLYAGPYIDLLPQSYQVQAPPGAVHLSPLAGSAPAGQSPEWLADLPDAPTVLVTFGTVFNRVPGVFETVIEELADLPVNVVVTTGRNRAPDGLGPLPANVHAESFIPYSVLLPQCDVVVCHAGFGTTMAALAHDLPVVCVPLSADQPVHARRCEQLGVGIHIRQEELTPETVARAVDSALSDPAVLHRAAHLGSEIRAMPGPEPAADVLERAVDTGGD